MKTKTELLTKPPTIKRWDAARVCAYKSALQALLKNKSEAKEPALLEIVARFYEDGAK